jgi:hypothetical protein
MSELTSKIKAAVTSAVKDLASLEVATLTNPESNPINLSDDVKIGDVFTQIKGNLKGADLVAYSHFSIDGDSTNYITRNKELTSLIEDHEKLVESSRETRKAFFDTIYKAVENMV